MIMWFCFRPLHCLTWTCYRFPMLPHQLGLSQLFQKNYQLFYSRFLHHFMAFLTYYSLIILVLILHQLKILRIWHCTKRSSQMWYMTACVGVWMKYSCWLLYLMLRYSLGGKNFTFPQMSLLAMKIHTPLQLKTALISPPLLLRNTLQEILSFVVVMLFGSLNLHHGPYVN